MTKAEGAERSNLNNSLRKIEIVRLLGSRIKADLPLTY
jgi:hypothetical protein